MEADVNVLVVGGGAARRGAIGRHLPRPLIRRRSLTPAQPAKAAVATLQTNEAGDARERGVHATRVGGSAHSPVSLLTWRVQARTSQRSRSLCLF